MFLSLISDTNIILLVLCSVWCHNVACIIFIIHKPYWILYFCTVIWNDVLQFTFVFHQLKYTSSHHYLFRIYTAIIIIFISIVFRYISIHHCYRIKTPLSSSPVVTVILSWLINCWIQDLVPISRLQMRYFNNRLYLCS